MNEIKITIPDYHIVPKARPKVTKNGTYMPTQYIDCKLVVKAYGMRACKYDDMLEGYLGMEVVFFRKRAGDADNLEGTIMDALQGIVYDNDSQIKDSHPVVIPITGTKYKQEMTYIRIWELEKNWIETVLKIMKWW